MNSGAIKKINANDILEIRHKILRPNQPIESCVYETDHHINTVHYGYFENNRLVGITSIHREHLKYYSNITAYRLRGMAVIDNQRNKGLGSKLLATCIRFCQKNNIEMLWCNARACAIKFYEKNTFKIIGKPFYIEKIGKHYIAVKKL